VSMQILVRYFYDSFNFNPDLIAQHRAPRHQPGEPFFTISKTSSVSGLHPSGGVY
jgi:hypothetical protein